MLDAGVVDQHIERAELGLAGAHHGFDLGRLGHVGAVIGHAATKRFNLGLGGGHIAKAIEHHIGAAAGQHQRHAQADAAGRSGDQGGASFEHHNLRLNVVVIIFG